MMKHAERDEYLKDEARETYIVCCKAPKCRGLMAKAVWENSQYKRT